MTQKENTARHSPRGACGSPAGSDGVGGYFSARGEVHDGTVIPFESGVIHRSEVWKFTA